ncbi:MAG TPA: hypothetical protein DDW21_03475 [Verrucomicrobiales bacterium]|nr:MAG: hypothetical protein B9S37_05175 [Verrucomicrobiae bacterium Tous-C3TDCM]PAZ07237.1 MAG: hypothetical protein CAK88_00570 [Verrucomicrobiae bacterium AMD-G2]HBE22507.1 hypothetical protein [Verrucomicrobiales bacterium]
MNSRLGGEAWLGKKRGFALNVTVDQAFGNLLAIAESKFLVWHVEFTPRKMKMTLISCSCECVYAFHFGVRHAW